MLVVRQHVVLNENLERYSNTHWSALGFLKAAVGDIA